MAARKGRAVFADGKTFPLYRAKPHGLPVGKPPCHPVGWLPRRTQSWHNRLPEALRKNMPQAERAEAGPGREQVAKESAR